MSSISSVSGERESIAVQTASRAAAGAAEAADNKADGKENVNSYRNNNIKNKESDSVEISTAAQTASDATEEVAKAASKEAAEGAEAAKSGKAIADVDLKVVSKADKSEKSEKSAPLGSKAKADNTSNVAGTQKKSAPVTKESIFTKKDNAKTTTVPQSQTKETETNTQIKDSQKTMGEKEAKESYEANGREQVNAEAQLSAIA